MANQHDIKKYLLDKETSYLNNTQSNGKILMLSGVWGSGKTHFWKNEIENDLITKLKRKEKSYVFVSLYGKDSIEELQNDIYQSAYNFSMNGSKDIISSASSVFTKVATFMPKVSLFGIEVEFADSAEKVELEKYKQQVEKGMNSLKEGGVICFDDFERKSSKIDLNDLFGFITNLTEEFQTKTIIITNQEFFKENDSEIFSRIKEKSVNKFLLLDPTVEELFETIYKEKYTELNEYKEKILEAIKVTEEKNARVFIQVLDHCLEYKENAKNKHEIFMLVLITVLFVKYNLIFKVIKNDSGHISTKVFNDIPSRIAKFAYAISASIHPYNKQKFIGLLKGKVSNSNEKNSDTLDKVDDIFIDNNQDLFYQTYKYIIKEKYFKEEDKELIEKLNNFVESGIL